MRAIATAQRSSVPIEGPESSDRDLLLRPMHERYRALLAAGRGLAGEARQWAAKAISSAEGTGHLAGARGSGRAVWPVVAPSGLSVCDPRAGTRRGSREIFPPGGGCRVADMVDSVVVVELTLVPVRHQAKDPHVQVVHDRAPPGSGTGSEAATAWGSG